MSEQFKEFPPLDDAEYERRRAAQLAPIFDHGKYYRGIRLPKGYRKRKETFCFHNAQCLAINGRGRYI